MTVGRDRLARTRYPLRLRRRAVPWADQEPTWRDARPALISAALSAAQARPCGNWYVLGATRDTFGARPLARTVAGEEIVAWRGRGGTAVAGPGICPHLGAPLSEGPVCDGVLRCRWHGLALDGSAGAGWRPYPVHDDGVLTWVRLDHIGKERPLPAPAVPARPAPGRSVAAVYTGIGRCDPQDIVANRLDPWHGAWLHPYSFVDLTVIPGSPSPDGPGQDTPAVTVDVSFKLAGRLVVPVRAVFTAPGPRTVVMRITQGEGAGSVVETHATPLRPEGHEHPRTAVVEAVIATSDRPGFVVARTAAALLRPLMRASARRLWRDDLAYAERRRYLRSAGTFPG